MDERRGADAAIPVRGKRVVALTGAASFLGKNLVGALEEDPRVERVVCIDVKAPETAGDKTRTHHVDLTAEESVARVADVLEKERVDTLAHLAFLSSPTHATAWEHELESIGTMHLLNAARRARVAKLVLSSTTLLYGAHPTNPNFLTEKHPLRADPSEPFFADKIAAEQEVQSFAAKSRSTVVTTLRTAMILGPTVENLATRYFAQESVMTLLGFDPLFQFVHESDVIAAFMLAILKDHPGVFNVVGEGVLPLSTAVKLAGKKRVPIPSTLARATLAGLWTAQVAYAPPSFLPYLRYLCVADGEKAARVMGFRPMHTSREALLDAVNASKLRATLAEEARAGAREIAAT